MPGLLDDRYVRGAVIVLGGVLLMSFDAALIRAVGQPAGVLSLWRGVLICAAMVLAASLCHAGGARQRWHNEWAAWGNGLMFGVASVAFVYSIESTSAANTLFIMATMPVWSAVLGRVFLRTSIDRPTVLAIMVSLVGMTIIFASQLSSAAGRGELLALLAAVSMSGGFVFSSRRRSSPFLTTAVGGALCALTAAVFLRGVEVPALGSWLPLVAEGFVVMPVGLVCLSVGPRLLPVHHVAIFVLAETVLGPVWVWMFFHENPGPASLVGGAVVIGAIVSLNMYYIRLSRKERVGAV
ncbi:EamA/RhaT family transporter [Actinomyces sp. 2119]|uniref:DMT family transporter n=1 Tax=Actinomyces sp. 2119 TaxID=2321393 RepID=UPI000E6B59FA|nr:DMT family transporter [Actinomyces sp. 2119]RJF43218.1 EamA/RhaT family transporter [Actinomyces sp. 2119]